MRINEIYDYREGPIQVVPIFVLAVLVAVVPGLHFLGEPFLGSLGSVALVASWAVGGFVILWRAACSTNELQHIASQNWRDILKSKNHFCSTYYVVVPLKNETNPDVLRRLLRSVCSQSYPKDKIEVVLVVEEEDIATTYMVREAISNLRERIKISVIRYSPQKYVVASKATSLTEAGRQIAANHHSDKNKRAAKFLVADADTVLHKDDLAYREYTHEYTHKNTVLQSMTTYTVNFHQTAPMPRLHSVLWCIWQMGLARVRGDYLVLGPGMSINLAQLVKLGYFFPLRHNEDMLFRYKAIFEGVPVRPLLIPTWGLAPWTNKGAWIQIGQWARGVRDLSFISQYIPTRSETGCGLELKRWGLLLHAVRSHTIPSTFLLIPVIVTGMFLLVIGERIWTKSELDYVELAYGVQVVVCILCLIAVATITRHVVRPVLGLQVSIVQKHELSLAYLIRNFHYLAAMVAATVGTQARVAIGRPVSKTLVTKK